MFHLGLTVDDNIIQSYRWSDTGKRISTFRLFLTVAVKKIVR